MDRMSLVRRDIQNGKCYGEIAHISSQNVLELGDLLTPSIRDFMQIIYKKSGMYCPGFNSMLR